MYTAYEAQQAAAKVAREQAEERERKAQEWAEEIGGRIRDAATSGSRKLEVGKRIVSEHCSLTRFTEILREAGYTVDDMSNQYTKISW